MHQIQKVVAAVVVEDGRILVAQRARGAQAGKWEFPGGKVEAGETLRAALVRELQEELAVKVQVGPRIMALPFSSNGMRLRLIAFYARHASGVFTPLSHRAIDWVGPDELARIDLAPPDIPVALKVQAQWGVIPWARIHRSDGPRPADPPIRR